MGFPKELLGSDEELILELRPHWMALVKPMVTAAIIVAAMVVANAYVPDDWPGWVHLLIVLAGLVWLGTKPVRRIVAWATSLLVVTSDRIVHRSGLISKQSMEIPLQNVTDVRFSQSVLERLVGAGDLVLESPGEYGQERFSHISQPDRVQGTIYELTEENRKRMASVTSLDPVSPNSHPSASVADELMKLARLRKQGVLTEEEFQQQKSRLLRLS